MGTKLELALDPGVLKDGFFGGFFGAFLDGGGSGFAGFVSDVLDAFCGTYLGAMIVEMWVRNVVVGL